MYEALKALLLASCLTSLPTAAHDELLEPLDYMALSPDPSLGGLDKLLCCSKGAPGHMKRVDPSSTLHQLCTESRCGMRNSTEIRRGGDRALRSRTSRVLEGLSIVQCLNIHDGIPALRDAMTELAMIYARVRDIDSLLMLQPVQPRTPDS